MNANELPPLWSAVIFILFLGFILSLRWLATRSDAWQQLARQYPAAGKAQGKVWKLQGIVLDQTAYNRLVKFITNDDGLFIQITWFPYYDYGRMRIFIPWQEFHEATLVKPPWLWTRVVVTTVGNPPIELRLPANIFEETEGRKVLVKTINYWI